MSGIPSIDLYRRLFFARRCEDYIIRHYPEDRMRTPMHMSYGQEHIPVGICRGLEGTGDIFASYRSHASFLAQTMDSDRFFGELYGRVNGTADGKSGSMHLSAPDRGHFMASAIVGSTVPVAVGAAYASRELGTGRIAVVFFGDGAVDEGEFWESINAASVFALPMFFVCEDNGWAVHTAPRAHRGFTSFQKVAELFGCYFFADDSNDVERIYEIAQAARRAVANRPRPVLMHLQCCRYLEHVGIGEDFKIGYRPKAEVDAWRAKDSLMIQRERLLAQGRREAEVAALEEEIDAAIGHSVARAAQASIPEPERLFKGIFHEPD